MPESSPEVQNQQTDAALQSQQSAEAANSHPERAKLPEFSQSPQNQTENKPSNNDAANSPQKPGETSKPIVGNGPRDATGREGGKSQWQEVIVNNDPGASHANIEGTDIVKRQTHGYTEVYHMQGGDQAVKFQGDSIKATINSRPERTKLSEFSQQKQTENKLSNNDAANSPQKPAETSKLIAGNGQQETGNTLNEKKGDSTPVQTQKAEGNSSNASDEETSHEPSFGEKAFDIADSIVNPDPKEHPFARGVMDNLAKRGEAMIEGAEAKYKERSDRNVESLANHNYGTFAKDTMMDTVTDGVDAVMGIAGSATTLGEGLRNLAYTAIHPDQPGTAQKAGSAITDIVLETANLGPMVVDGVKMAGAASGAAAVGKMAGNEEIALSAGKQGTHMPAEGPAAPAGASRSQNPVLSTESGSTPPPFGETPPPDTKQVSPESTGTPAAKEQTPTTPDPGPSTENKAPTANETKTTESDKAVAANTKKESTPLEAQMKEARTAEAMQKLKERDPELAAYVDNSKMAMQDGKTTLKDLASDNPQGIADLWNEYKSEPRELSFDKYVNKRIDSEFKPSAGEAREHFERGKNPNNITVEGGGRSNQKGFDGVSYDKTTGETTLWDDKYQSRNVYDASALVENLPQNLKTTINDLETLQKQPGSQLPPEITNKVLPDLQAALKQIDNFMRKLDPHNSIPKETMKSPAVQKEISNILKQNDIKREITLGNSPERVKIGPGLKNKFTPDINPGSEK